MRQNVYNVLFFVFLASGLVALWFYADQNWFPKNEVAKKYEPEKKKDEKKDDKPPVQKNVPPPPPKVDPKPPAAFVPPELIRIGGDGFYIESLLTTQGG